MTCHYLDARHCISQRAELNSAVSISPLIRICTALGWSPSVALKKSRLVLALGGLCHLLGKALHGFRHRITIGMDVPGAQFDPGLGGSCRWAIEKQTRPLNVERMLFSLGSFFAFYLP